ncbi:MAG: hypothetical protein WCK02_07785 [Bacteroidota bacterium]
MERRDFIKNVARGSILTSIGLLGGLLLFKDKKSDFCDFHFVCSKCQQLSECKLPEADKFKKINGII